MSINEVEMQEHHATLLSAESLEQDLKTKSQQRHLSIEDLTDFIDKCLLLKAKSRKEMLVFARMLLALILSKPTSLDAEKGRDLFYPLLGKLLDLKVDPNWQVGAVYHAIILDLLGYSAKNQIITLSKRSLCFRDCGGVSSENHIPHLQESAECLLFAAVFGARIEDIALMKEVAQASYAHLDLFDHVGRYPKSFWLKESEFDEKCVYFFHALLFSAMHKITKDTRFNEKLCVIQKRIDSLYGDETPHLFDLFGSFVEASLKEVRQPIAVKGSEMVFQNSIGFGHFENNVFSVFCTTSGSGTSFATCTKGDVEIVAMGPHHLPLGLMENFGIYRTPLLKEICFREVTCKKTESDFSYEGYTRVIEPAQDMIKPGSSWLKVVCNASDTSVDFEMERFDMKGGQDFDLAVFIKADKAVIDAKYQLLPMSLNRYEGESLPCVFTSNKTKLTLRSNAKRRMKIIPLAGESHFFGATFLLAFPIQVENTLKISLS